jgi:transposase-like protein
VVGDAFEDVLEVDRVALKYGVNANQVFQWRRLYPDGKLGVPPDPPRLLTWNGRLNFMWSNGPNEFS